MNRRQVLAAAGAIGISTTAGCSSLTGSEPETPPVGSLQFENQTELPHILGVRVTDIGAERGDDTRSVTGDVSVPNSQRSLSASASLEAGEVRTYENVFTEPIWYDLVYMIDGRQPEGSSDEQVYSPIEDSDGRGMFLSVIADREGTVSWEISPSEEYGEFDPNS